MPTTGGLTEALLCGLMDSFVSEGSGARDNADMSSSMNIPRHNACKMKLRHGPSNKLSSGREERN